jgi:hypothetical protein
LLGWAQVYFPDWPRHDTIQYRPDPPHNIGADHAGHGTGSGHLARSPRFHADLARIPTLPEPLRASALAALIDNIHHLQAMDQADAFLRSAVGRPCCQGRIALRS